jgi:type I restriction enzyme S subunit
MSDAWRSIRLGDACLKVGSGATPRGGKESYLKEGPVTLIRSQNVLNDRFSRAGLAYISDEQASLLNNVTVEPYDVLLNITGDSVARCTQVDAEILPARVNQHVAIVRPDPQKLHARFLKYFLVAPQTQQHLLQLASAGATRPALTKAMIEGLPVLAPVTVAEQRAIASVLGALDDKIELNRKICATLEAIAHALYKAWFVDFDPVRAKAEGRDTGLTPELAALFPDRFEGSVMGEIPKGWAMHSLEEAVEVNPANSLAGISETPYLDMANVPTSGYSVGQIISRPVSSGSRFRNGDTLFARITPCLENGKTAFVDFLDEGQVGCGSTEFIVLRPRVPLPAEYGYLLARSEAFRSFAIAKMTGTSGRQRVPVDAIASFFTALPPSVIVEAFAAVIQPSFKRISAAHRESRMLANLRDALLPKLISGEIRVDDIEECADEENSARHPNGLHQYPTAQLDERSARTET